MTDHKADKVPSVLLKADLLTSGLGEQKVFSGQYGFSLDLGKSFTILRVNMMLVLNVFQWLIVVTLYPALLVLYRRNGPNTAI